LSKQYKDNGTLIPLNNLLEYLEFWNYSVQITYPEVESFIKFLMDTYGMENMKDFIYFGDLDDMRALVKSNFQSVYGFSIKQAEDEWLIFLDNY